MGETRHGEKLSENLMGRDLDGGNIKTDIQEIGFDVGTVYGFVYVSVNTVNTCLTSPWRAVY
jgi:hypothetical protein